VKKHIAPLAAASVLAALLAGCSKGSDPEIVRVRELQSQGNTKAVALEAENSDMRVARVAVESLGHMGPDAIPHIQKALQDPRIEVREIAAIAYAEAAPQNEMATLSSVARTDPSPAVRATAVVALGQVYAFSEIDTLFAAIEDPDRAVRVRASAALARMIGRRYETYIDGTPEQRRQIVAALRQLWPTMERGVRENLDYVRKARQKKP
jgi:HEAT repeat protein